MVLVEFRNLNFWILQGTVATQGVEVRWWGGNLTQFLVNLPVKDFENKFAFSEVMTKRCISFLFWGETRCIIVIHCQ